VLHYEDWYYLIAASNLDRYGSQPALSEKFNHCNADSSCVYDKNRSPREFWMIHQCGNTIGDHWIFGTEPETLRVSDPIHKF
jgi:hypothetical protein